MKRLCPFYIICALFIAAFPAFAERISTDDARRVAVNFARERGLHAPEQYRATHVQTRRVSSGALRASTDESVYYVFSQPAGEGFIIVSAIDAAKPVLGYSTQGSYSEDNPNFSYWMNYLSDQIVAAIEQNIEGDEATKREWQDLREGAGRELRASAASVPNLISTKWDQLEPYNKIVSPNPEDSIPTGCVATAIAQIMKYYNYPTHGTGSHTSDGSPRYTVNFADATYQWNNMLDIYSEGNYNDAQADAVATLMYHCGVAVDMLYTPKLSGALGFTTGNAFMQYFGYDKGVKIGFRDSYSTASWEELLKSELNEGRPVLYGSFGGSHEFICSGYDENIEQYYFNWGWSGEGDGYYAINALKPLINSSVVADFTNGQHITYNIKPDPEGTSRLDYWLYQILTASKSSVGRGETFNISLACINMGYLDFDETVGIAIIDSNGQISTVTGETNFSVDKLSVTSALLESMYDTISVQFSFPITTTPGVYTLKLVYKKNDGNWSFIPGPEESNLSEVTITVTAEPEPATDLQILYDLSSTKTTVNINEELDIIAWLTNRTTSAFTGTIAAVICDQSDNIIAEIKTADISILINRNLSVSLSNCRIPSSISPGNYNIRIATKTPEGNLTLIDGQEETIADFIAITITNNPSPPKLINFKPANTAVNVRVSGSVQLFFNRTMDTSNGYISIGGAIFNNTVWSENNTVCTIPYTGLPYGTTVNMQVAGFKDVSGYQMLEVSTIFTTEPAPTGLQLTTDLLLYPSPQLNITEKFDLNMSIANRSANSFNGSIAAVFCNFSSDSIIVVSWSDNLSLPANSGAQTFNITNIQVPVILPGTYKLRLAAKQADSDWSLIYGNTPATVDSVIVSVTSSSHSYPGLNNTTPTPNSTNVPVAGQVQLVFNRTMDPSFGYINLGGWIFDDKTWSQSNTVCTISYTGLAGNTTYDMQIAGFKDDRGYQMSATSYKFTTAVVAETPPPTLVSITPANNATNVPVGGTIRLVFDRPMNTSAAYAYGSVNLNGTSFSDKIWSENNTVCTIPYRGLTHGTTINVEVSSGFRDASGLNIIATTSTFTTVAAPATTTWQPQNNSTDWFANDNWTNGIPAPSTDVYINQSPSWPVLNYSATVASLTLAPGTELGHQERLTCSNIRIAYDFSAAASRNRSWLLASPIQGVFAGDFTFGGYPSAFLYEYTTNSSEEPWQQITDLGKELTPGKGFALFLRDDDADGKGIKLTNGIVRQPYFDIADAAAHPAYDVASGSFYRYDATKTVDHGDIAATVSRDNTGKPALLLQLTEGLPHITIPVVYANDGCALVGNPLLSTLDFTKLASFNNALIKKTFHVWTGNSTVAYATYNPEGWSGDMSISNQGAYIAPLQGFFVEKNLSSSYLWYDTTMMATAHHTSLRSPAQNDSPITDKLNITATAGDASTLTFIARRNNGSNYFSEADSRKLFNGISEAPNVYTLKYDDSGYLIPTSANIVSDGNITVPVGIETNYEGEIIFTFTGMDTYEATIYLLDVATNSIIDLTGLSSYAYRFNYAPRRNNGTAIATNDRFTLYINHAPLDINRLADTDIRVHANGRILNVATTDGSPLRTVEIWSPQGQLITVRRNIDAASLSVNLPGIAQETVIVRATTDRSAKRKKVIIKDDR